MELRYRCRYGEASIHQCQYPSSIPPPSQFFHLNYLMMTLMFRLRCFEVPRALAVSRSLLHTGGWRWGVAQADSSTRGCSGGAQMASTGCSGPLLDLSREPTLSATSGACLSTAAPSITISSRTNWSRHPTTCGLPLVVACAQCCSVNEASHLSCKRSG